MSQNKNPPRRDGESPRDGAKGEAPRVKQDVPTITSLGRLKTPDGWVVFKLVTKGDEVVSKEIVDGPGSRGQSDQALKIEMVRTFFLPDKVSA